MKQKPTSRYADLSIDVLTGLVLEAPDHYQLHGHCPICKVKVLGLCHDKIRSKLSGSPSLDVVLKTRSSVRFYICRKLLLGTITDQAALHVPCQHAYTGKTPNNNNNY
jgi:hypothetical protein